MTVPPIPSPTAARATGLDVERIRRDFPILSPARTGGRLIYLDSAATAQKPQSVIDALVDFYATTNANVHRGVYGIAVEATQRMEAARETVRALLNASTPREVIFTRGTTEAINLVAYSWGRANVGAGDVILGTELEHHSNLVPWQQLAAQQGASYRVVPVDDSGRLAVVDAEGNVDEAALDAIVGNGRLRLFAFGHVSNALGTVNPVQALVAWAHSRDALALVDGAQSAPHRAVDVANLGCDFYAFSGHKLCGPTGAGALWARESILRAMPPFQFGGEMIERVSIEQTTFNDIPWKFEAGTPAVAQIIGMAAAIDYLQAIGFAAIEQHERELGRYLIESLESLAGVTVLGPPAGAWRGGVASFVVDGIHPHDVSELLNGSNVCVRAGQHCVQPLLQRLGHPATARASVYLYNDRDDVDALVTSIVQAQKVFGG